MLVSEGHLSEGEEKAVEEEVSLTPGALSSACSAVSAATTTSAALPGEAGDPADEGEALMFESKSRKRILIPQMMGFTIVLEQSTDMRHVRIQLLNKDHMFKFERIYDVTEMHKAGFPARKNAESIVDLIMKLCKIGGRSSVRITKGADQPSSSSSSTATVTSALHTPLSSSVDITLQFRRFKHRMVGIMDSTTTTMMMMDMEIIEQMALDDSLSDHTQSIELPSQVTLNDFALITISNEILDLKLILDALHWRIEEKLQFENDLLRDTVAMLRSELECKDRRIMDLENKLEKTKERKTSDDESTGLSSRKEGMVDDGSSSSMKKTPVCKCGLKMELQPIREIYPITLGMTPYCDSCGKWCQPGATMWHCPKGNSLSSHWTGYDICEDCGGVSK